MAPAARKPSRTSSATGQSRRGGATHPTGERPPRGDSPRKSNKRPAGAPMRIADHLVKLIALLSRFDSPADAVLSHYFRANPKLGSGDRHWIAESAYTWLRLRPRIAHLCEGGQGPVPQRRAQLSLLLVNAPQKLWALGAQEEHQWLSRVLAVKLDSLPLEHQLCLPFWLWSRLVEQIGQADAERFAQSVLEPAPLDLRVNRIKATVQQVSDALQTAGIEHAPVPGLPDALRLQTKPALSQLDAFRDGGIEVQDAGSQWIAAMTAPRRGDLVVDFCAGAGGKTLAVGSLMRNTGRLLAVDTSQARLSRLKPRLQRSGLSNVYPLAIDSEHDVRLDRYRRKADRVLVDAPCSGMGTLRRNPDLKWRQTAADLAELVVKQASIIAAASELVRPDGRLIYATCSVLREENEDIIQGFLETHPDFRLRHWNEILAPDNRPPHLQANPDKPWLRLWPHQDGCDGFFVAVLQRDAAGDAAQPEGESA